MYVYCVDPIDFGWENLSTVAETAARLGAATAVAAVDKQKHAGPLLDVSEFLHAWEVAQVTASGAGWEGDFRDDPVVFWIPYADGFRFGFVFKQDNNGTTFVLSPVEMPWVR